MSKHSLYRLADKYLYDQPLLSTVSQLEDITAYIEDRNSDISMSLVDSIGRKNSESSYGEKSIAIVPVEGALSYKAHMFESLCEMSSYQTILANTREVINLGYKTLVYDVDSGGGEAYGCFETALEIQKMCKEAGVKTIGYVDGTSASAAYATCCGFDEIIANPEAKVGSVGVVVQLKNDSKKEANEGVHTKYIYAGKNKIPFDEEGEFTESFISDLQESVDTLYEGFLSHVSQLRGIEKEAVRSTEAKMYKADKALELGLVDKVMTRAEFAEYLAEQQEDNEMDGKSLILNVKEETQKMSENQTKETLDSVLADKAALSEQLAGKEQLLAELTSKNEALAEVVASLKQDKEDAQMQARKSELSEVLSDDKLDEVFSAVKGLDDASFSAIVSSYSSMKASVQESELMTEVGLGGENESESLSQESSLMQLIQKTNKGNK